MHEKDYIDIFILSVLAMFGGMTKYIATLRKKPKFSFLFFFVESFVALFMGLIIALLGKATKVDMYYTAALCGLSGLWGAQFFKAIIRQFIPLVEEAEKNPR